MRYASFEINGQASYGVVDGAGQYRRVPVAFQARYANLKDVIAADALVALAEAAMAGGEQLKPEQVRLLPVIPNPGKLICVGLNYKSHVAETRRADSEYPSLFLRFNDSLAAHDDVVLRPAFSERFDWEGELAFVIGKGGRHIAKEKAFEHIAGYACFNDVSVRDWQKHTHQFTPGKNFPGTAPFGPVLVSRDEVPDVTALTLETRVNGQVVQHASVGDLIFDIPTIVAYVSRFTPLSPGDVIATGTPGGVGDRREPPMYMKEGDVAEVEITGLGVLRNRIGTDHSAS
ncbi:fumarylacetoacetate (FAA) hydrolase family protein [Hydrogenophaga sp. RAC07]|uniref:fumarylacetoacetate hydrolase family protein n=1 Tax=Hydrogenophaga sp. RAC07 TaxID=1842537 RepID=UPI00083E3766|nr:fumarylacetoacetate hydrolase family protein [Hydrogenophaga sp. RAC07]AOF86773.1 fumarylacetoacetate (FAA) hydrolase family protein [Hydrogenophaga sp. RAC07]